MPNQPLNSANMPSGSGLLGPARIGDEQSKKKAGEAPRGIE